MSDKFTQFEFDAGRETFVKAGVKVVTLIKRFAGWLLSSVTLVILAYVAFSLFFSTDVERRLRRDCGERGWSLENAQRNYEQIVKPAHMLYVEPARAKADIVLNDALDDAALQVLAAGIRAAAEN